MPINFGGKELVSVVGGLFLLMTGVQFINSGEQQGISQPSGASAPAPKNGGGGGVREQMGSGSQYQGGNEVLKSNLGEVITRGGKDYLKCSKLGTYGSPEQRLGCNSWCTNSFLPRGNDGWKGGVVVKLDKNGKTKCEAGGN